MKKSELFEEIIKDMKKKGMLDDLFNRLDCLIDEALMDYKMDIMTIGLVPNGVSIGLHKGLMEIFTEKEIEEIMEGEVQEHINLLGYNLDKKIKNKIRSLDKSNELEQRLEILKKIRINEKK